MKNLLKEKLESGKPVLGTFAMLGPKPGAECLALGGMDFMIVDTEHGPFDVETAIDYVVAAERHGVTPLVRVKDPSRPSVLKMLDIGAMGLIIPFLETVGDVRKLVEYGKYYPLGRRGFAMGRSAGFGFAPVAAQGTKTYFETCNRETLLIPQCETMGCLENIEEIAAIEGVDGIFIGPYDLSVALGKPTQFEDPEFLAAVGRIVSACRSAGKLTFIYAGSLEKAKDYWRAGFDAVAYSNDAAETIKALQNATAYIKG